MKIFNPFYIYSLVFSVALFLYELRWSKLYFNLSPQLEFFLYISIILFFIVGLLFSNTLKKISTVPKNVSFQRKNHIWVTVIIFVVNLAEGIYSRGFPLINSNLVYKDFGIPTIHVVFFVVLYFYVVRTFEKYLYTRKKELLIFSVLNMYPFILSVNRGLLVLIFLNFIFLYINVKRKSLSFKQIITLISVLFFGSIIFGWMGNQRVNQNYKYDSNYRDSYLILNIGEATSSFKEAPIPESLFWVYLYSSSPLANLQNNINNYSNTNKNSNKAEFILTQLLPDTISKRIITPTERVPYLIRPELTVGTAYMESYMLLGFYGIYFFNIFFLLYIIFSILLVKKFCPEYSNFVISVLCVMSALLIFSNSLSYSAISLQVLLPFIAVIIKKIKLR